MNENEESLSEVAPSHTDVRTEYDLVDQALVLGLGAIAIVAGTVLGLVYTK